MTCWGVSVADIWFYFVNTVINVTFVTIKEVALEPLETITATVAVSANKVSEP